MGKQVTLLLTVLVGIMLYACMVSGALTFVTPVTGDELSKTQNVSLLNADAIELVNCTITISSASTNATTAVSYTVLNTSTTQSQIETTWNRINYQDSNDYIMGATCRNQTNSAYTATSITGIIIDTGVPTTPSALDPATDTSLKSQQTTTFSATVTDANTTACTYIISRGGADVSDTINYVTGSATYSASSCTFTKEFTQASNGDWTWSITASDGSNTTASANTVYKVALQTGGGAGSIVSSPAPVKISEPSAVTTTTGESFFQKIIDFFKKLFKIE